MNREDVDAVALAERHRAALYDLVDHIVAHAGSIYDNDFESAVRDVIVTFDEFIRSGLGSDPYPDDGLDFCGRSHSFVTAQCCALLLFTHEVAGIAEREQLASVQASIGRLRQELSRRYEQFFGESC